MPPIDQLVALFPGPTDLLHKTSWINASIALRQIRKGRATGNKAALVVRSKFQRHLYDIGCFSQKNPGTVLFVGLLVLLSALVGLKSAKIDTNIDKLCVEAGGRLEKEIDYVKETLGDGFENTNQLIIQTPSNENANILHPNALLLHLEALRVGTEVTVDMFSTSWRLKDICYSLSIPAFEEQLIDAALDKLIPCAIITPLDCFWEGSKLLGPEITIPRLNLNLAWTNFNPESLLELAKNQTISTLGSNNRYPFETFENLMSRAGISTAYQNRPCLNPLDEECPESSPNKRTTREPDVGYELTGGCYGFATKWMHWPEELIVGGIKKSKNGRIVKAHALQSIIQLMAEQDMFAYWQDNSRVLHIDWTIEKARQVLEAWQRKFVAEVDRYIKDNSITDYKIEKFTNVALLDIMKNFSIPNVVHLIIGYCLLLIFTSLSRINLGNSGLSQSALGIAGVLLIALAIASGLGFCCLIGFPFNASTTQIIPFLALGLGSAPLFLLMDVYEENVSKDTHSRNPIADTLQQIGFSILLNTFTLLCSFGAAAIIPIPALRYFVAQTAILITFITMTLLIIFPAIMSLDLQRRKSRRYDLFCCFKIKSSSQLKAQSSSSSSQHKQHRHHHHHHDRYSKVNNHRDRRSQNYYKDDCEDDRKLTIKIPPIKQTESPVTSINNYTFKPYLFDLSSSSSSTNSKSSRPSSSTTTKCATNKNSFSSSNVSTPVMPIRTIKPLHYNLPSPPPAYFGDIEAGTPPLATSSSPLQPPPPPPPPSLSPEECYSDRESDDLDGPEDDEGGNDDGMDDGIPLSHRISLNYFVTNIYIPLLQRRIFKLLVMILSFIIFLICLSGVTQVKDGLDLTDIVPRDTSEYRFLLNQRQYFNVYNMHAVTQGNFEYPTNQGILIEYHNAFTRVPRIIKNDDGGLPEFWLVMFRDWLIGLQAAFDADWKNGSISQERWYPNASAEGILAYKLLVQTGRVDNPVDKSLVTKVKLVDNRGIINPKAFYNYLTAWVTNDAIAYSASQANFHPEPRQWIHVASDYDLKIPKSQPLVYAQIPFYLHNMNSTEEITLTIQDIRAICKNYEDKGLPNFPTGLPFTYWEQYIRLRISLGASLVVVFAIIFVALCTLLVNCWASSMLTFVLGLTSVQIFGLMGLLGIRLSAIPAVILIIAVGKSIHVLIHLLMSFLTSMGSRDYRVIAALNHMFPPLVRSEISTFIGISMLAFSEFDFIKRDFFITFSGTIALSAWNGLVFYPVLLCYLGPPGEVLPHEYENRISTPSPPSSPPVRRKRHSRNAVTYSRRIYPRVQSEISLSTISEEPPSYQSSHEIVVQPELVVETTTVTNSTPQPIMTQPTTSHLPNEKSGNVSSSSDRDSPETPLSRDSPASASDSGASSLSRSSSTTTTIYPPYNPANLYAYPPQTVTTKVTTTAKLKVELHAPYMDRDSSTNRNKNKDRRSSSRC